MPDPTNPHRGEGGGIARRIVRFGAPLLVGVVVLGVWQVCVDWFNISAYVLPSPRRVAATLADPDARATLASAWFVTVKTAGLALVSAAVGGTMMAVLLTSSRWIELSLFPYAVALQVTPLVAIAPLIVIWVGLERTELIWLICAWIVAFFPILSNTVIGLRSVDERLSDLFASLKASRLARLRFLLLPSALPFFLAGLKVSANLALVGAVVAEFITGAAVDRPGLASVIFDAQYRLDVALMFSALALIAVTGIGFYYVAHFLGFLLLRKWHDSFLPQRR